MATIFATRCVQSLHGRRTRSSCRRPFATTGQQVLSGGRLQTRAIRATCATMSLLKVTEKSTGVEFPLVQRFWEGDEYRCLGAAPRLKKVLFLNVKVYAIALYVEAAKAAKELKIRDRGDFFKDADQSSFCDAIMDGAFDKVLQIALVRDVTSEQFCDAIEEALGAKLRFIGANDVFEDFKTFISGQELKKSNTFILHWGVGGYLDAGVVSEGVSDFSVAIAGAKRFENAGFSRSMFELYMGQDSFIPAARETWANGARLLLESANA